MLKKIVAIAGLAILVSGCVQSTAPEFTNYEGESIQVVASMTPGVLRSKLQVTFNGETVIDDTTQALGGPSQNFTGTWRGKTVTARTMMVQRMFSEYMQIDVFLDGRLIESLTL